MSIRGGNITNVLLGFSKKRTFITEATTRANNQASSFSYIYGACKYVLKGFLKGMHNLLEACGGLWSCSSSYEQVPHSRMN